MKNSFENNTIMLYPEGHIDTSNAESVGAEIAEIRQAHPNSGIVMDCEALEYLSSAGLRQVLKLKKSCSDLKLINVSPEVYDVFEMTGFTEMMDIEKGYRRMEVNGCEVLGEGSNGIVYRYNADTIVKVYKNADAINDIQRERELAKRALVMGINTAIPYDVVKVGSNYASVFELLSSKSLSKWIIEDPENKDKYIKIFADFLRGIHNTLVPKDTLPSEKMVVEGWASYLESHLDAAHYEKLNRMIAEVPETDYMIHGDYHTNNIHYDGEEAIIIDMDTIAVGHPVFEMGSIFNAYVGFGLVDHTSTERFLKIDYGTCGYIWKKFLQFYYEKEDVTQEELKAKIVGLTRVLRRTIKREPENTALIEESRKQLTEAIDAVDTLL